MSEVAFIQTPPRPLEQLAGYVEYAYGLWERFGINTGAFIALLKALVAEAQRTVQLEGDGGSSTAALRIHTVVMKLRDNWSAHFDQEDVSLL
jgi:hypothetical protein